MAISVAVSPIQQKYKKIDTWLVRGMQLTLVIAEKPAHIKMCNKTANMLIT